MYLVALNLGGDPAHQDLSGQYGDVDIETGTIFLNTGHISSSKLNVGKSVDLREVVLEPGEGIVVRIDIAGGGDDDDDDDRRVEL